MIRTPGYIVCFPCFPNGFRSRGHCSAQFRAFPSLGHLFECHLCLFYFIHVSARIPGGYLVPLFDFRIFCHSTYFLRFRSLSGRISLAFYEHFCYSLCFDFISLTFSARFPSTCFYTFVLRLLLLLGPSGPSLAHSLSFSPTTLLCETCLHTVPLDCWTPSSPSSRSTLPFGFRDPSGFLP